MKHIFLLLLLCISRLCVSQAVCSFREDSIYLPSERKILSSKAIDGKLKKSAIQFHTASDGKLYLRLLVTENLYFDKSDVLELQSGKKSFYAKNVRQIELDRHTGYFVIELLKNYLATLRDEGLTAIVFNKTHTNFSKQDCAVVKETAKCFHDAISRKD